VDITIPIIFVECLNAKQAKHRPNIAATNLKDI